MGHNIPIRQTLIKELEQSYCCAKRIYHQRVIKSHEKGSTDAQKKGVYFETAVLGKGAHGQFLTDLPRKKNGTKTIDHVRIDSQIELFPEILKAEGISIPKESGRQINLSMPFKDFIIEGVVDFVSAMNSIIYGKHNPVLFDLKLTANINNTFGDFAWGTPELMDHLQMDMYGFMFREIFKEKLPKGWMPETFYLVFDYKPKPEYKLVRYEYDAYEKEESMKQRIIYAEEKIRRFIREDWVENPSLEACKDCPLKGNGCNKYPQITSITNDILFE